MIFWDGDTPDKRDEEDRRRQNHRWFAGLDLGQVSDWTALSVVKADFNNPSGFPDLSVVYLERYRNVLYPDVAQAVVTRLMRPPLWGQCDLVVDATGVGRGVTDIFTKGRVPFTGVTITGGEKEHQGDDEYWRVPKKTLVAAALIPFQEKRMKIASRLPLAPTLRAELAGFRWKQNPQTGHETATHREGEHDDLVLSVALASWAAHRFPTSAVDESLSEVVSAGSLPAQSYGRGVLSDDLPNITDWW